MEMPNESFYQCLLVDHFKGIKGYRTQSGKVVDIMNNELAIEVDFVRKWAESIGQCLQYAYETHKRPCIVFIYNYSKDVHILTSIVPVLTRLCIRCYTIDIFTRQIKLIID